MSAGLAAKIPWRTVRFPGELSRTTPCYTLRRCHTIDLQGAYNRLTAGRTGPLPRSRRRETNADGNRDTPRAIGAGLDIRVDARAERGDGDAHSWGVVSVAATVARRCTWREPNSMASATAATVTAEPVSDGAARGSNTHSTVAVGRGADVPDIPEIVSELSGAACHDSMPGTLSWESRCRMSSRTTRTSPGCVARDPGRPAQAPTGAPSALREPDGNVGGAASRASEETAEPGGTEQAHKTSR